MKLGRLLVTLYSFCFVVGCQSIDTKTGGSISVESSRAQSGLNPNQSPAGPQSSASPATQYVPAEAAQIAPTAEEALPDDLWQRIRSGLSWHDIENQQVDQAVDSYLAQP